ncbi:MAG: ATP-binding protein, partial [Planctomycetaceae bacterium]
QEPQAVVIVIEDTGPGIQVDDPQSIFQPFVTTKSKGGGFGLASCRHIVELHGGTIALLDRPAGAAFRIRLPRAPHT